MIAAAVVVYLVVGMLFIVGLCRAAGRRDRHE
jgi:hypothetical protein